MEFTRRGVPVVLDTNFLLLPFQRSVDLFGEVERLLESPHYFVVVKQTIDELEGLARRQRRDSPAAKASLLLVEKKGFTVERGFEGDADSAIASFCSVNKQAVVSTNDKALAARVLKAGCRVISSRGKGHLGLK